MVDVWMVSVSVAGAASVRIASTACVHATGRRRMMV